MQLADHEVTTREVKSWRGVHLLHFQSSACSQKVRILLAEKGIEYTSHHVNLARKQNATPWFLGINPRGVVPVLAHDGVVHVESNDIMEYADATLPSGTQPFFPQGDAESETVRRSLALEDSLHLDLRNVTMAFLVPARAARKSEREIERYQKSGVPNAARDKEVAYWRAFAKNGGVTEEALGRSLGAFRSAFAGLEHRLESNPWLIGDRISVLEIAWFISVHRLVTAGYPIENHPRLAALYERLLARNTFAREIDPAAPLRWALGAYGAYRRILGTTLREFASSHAQA
jgi:glutathione S-transferase